MRTKYTKEFLIPIVRESKCVSDVLRKIGLTPMSSSHKNMSKLIYETYNLDTSHFDLYHNSKNSNIKRTRNKEEFIKTFLKVNSEVFISTHILKLKLIKFDLIKEQCNECGNGNNWNGKHLSLHLDHINGNNKDNRIENLRILCPNCHSQTETYSGKNKKIRLYK